MLPVLEMFVLRLLTVPLGRWTCGPQEDSGGSYVAGTAGRPVAASVTGPLCALVAECPALVAAGWSAAVVEAAIAAAAVVMLGAAAGAALRSSDCPVRSRLS